MIVSEDGHSGSCTTRGKSSERPRKSTDDDQITLLTPSLDDGCMTESTDRERMALQLSRGPDSRQDREDFLTVPFG